MLIYLLIVPFEQLLNERYNKKEAKVVQKARASHGS